MVQTRKSTRAAEAQAARPSKRRQGRSAENQISSTTADGRDSISSALTPTTNNSEGENSTPATSKAVTPVPPSKAVDDTFDGVPISSIRPRRGRLTIELPEIPPDDDDDDIVGGPSRGGPSKRAAEATVSRPKRQRRNVSYDEDIDEYSELYGDDQSASAALARRLQHEEDQKASASTPARPIQRGAEECTGLLTTAANKLKKAKPNDPQHTGSGAFNKEVVLSLKKPNASGNKASDTQEAAITAEDDTSNASSDGNISSDCLMASDGHINDLIYNTDSDSESLSEPLSSSSLSYRSSSDSEDESDSSDGNSSTAQLPQPPQPPPHPQHSIRNRGRGHRRRRGELTEREILVLNHPELPTIWKELEDMPPINAGTATQPTGISLQLKPFQLEGLAWMKAMEKTRWKGGLLGDEMGLGKTIQAVSLIMSDYPAKMPTLVILPPVALGQWQNEIATYTNNVLRTIVFHGTNSITKKMTTKQLGSYDVIIISYNSLESMYRREKTGHKEGDGSRKKESIIHKVKFHRVILDEAHCIKARTTMTAKACFALRANYRWCLTGTPLQNRIGEFFSLLRFLEVSPYASYFCKDCSCASLEWAMDKDHRKCRDCGHSAVRHVSIFIQELLKPIQTYTYGSEGKEAFKKLRLLTDRIMLRRLKKDNTDAMELPVKEVHVDRQFFSEVERDFSSSIMGSTRRQFDTYVAQGVMLNNYANIFGLIMQMRQVADHPDLILKKSAEGGQNVLVCCICDDPAEEAIRSQCKHDFCRRCAITYLDSLKDDEPNCPRCHIPLSIDLEQPSIEQDELLMKKSSIINRINMENWTSSSKIELLVHKLHRLRSDKLSNKSIIFSQFTTMLQLIEWRLRRAGFTTVMLDGSMTPAQRQASIKHFMENPEVECFLVSLKAGGVALNLTEASHVFIVDPWWNPAAEWQSADRCHRIGQTRPCTITRLCIEDSVESRIVLLQEKKASMIVSTINGDEGAMESLSADDLAYLFRGG